VRGFLRLKKRKEQMNIKQVKKLEKEVFEGAFAIVADIQATIREVAENWTACWLTP
jgi:hypothetical protein